jgi:hypothetical protein
MSFPMNSVDNVTVAKSPAEVTDRIRSVFGDEVVLEVRERKAGKDDAVGHHDVWRRLKKPVFLIWWIPWQSLIFLSSMSFRETTTAMW